MGLLNHLTFLCALAPGLVSSLSNLPLSTSGRWILDSKGATVTYAGVNWPGAADAMLPEGLQYQSIENIVNKIKSLGMNAIRLTFAVEMIDDIYEGGDNTMRTSLIMALGETNGIEVFEEIVRHNPQFGNESTRLDAFDAVAAECNKQGIYIHLDNHISKAEWCCSTTDGNAWFGDTYFNVTNWHRAWNYMAEHGESWPALASVGMRNELRSPDEDPALASATYNWEYWYENMVANAKVIHAANANLLIFFSGLDFDTWLTPIPTGQDLGNGTVFRKDDFDFANKIVLELHNYANDATSCSDLENSLWNDGFDALDSSNKSIVNVLPVVMTEFGYTQDNATYNSVYATCLAEYLPNLRAGWTMWVIAGSYYIRSGTQDFDETWGLLDHTWSDWRSPEAISNRVVPMVDATLT